MSYRKLMVVLVWILCMAQSHNAMALCESVLSDGGFEYQDGGRGRIVPPWIGEGNAGIHIPNKNTGYAGNNAWARNTRGWNGIRQKVGLTKGYNYTLTTYIRTSGNVHDAYFGFRDAGQKPVSEIKINRPLPKYTKLTVRFRPEWDGTYYVFAGLWALNEDAWIEVDSFDMDQPNCEAG